MCVHLGHCLEENAFYSTISTFLCSIQLSISNMLSSGLNNKYVIGSIVVILGSVYPLILKFTKNGESKYPFMIGVAVCVKNTLMLFYYLTRYLSFLYESYSNNKNHQKTYKYSNKMNKINNNQHSNDSNVISAIHSSPSKLAWALNYFKSPNDESLHRIISQNPSEIEILSTTMRQETNTTVVDDPDPDPDDDGSSSDNSLTSKDIKSSIDFDSKFNCNCMCYYNIRHRLKLYLYLAPNALLVLINDILALYTLSFVSVATYAVFMQVTILFIVIVRYFCLNKIILKSQFISVLLSIFGMIIFKLIELERIGIRTTAVKSDMIGISLCMLRGVFKACDLVYVEWFIHHLNEIPFYEKQAIVSIWFVICSLSYLILYHGNDIFINHRYLFDGFSYITIIFICYGTFFAIMIYLLILRLDSMIMGFCQQMTVLFAVFFDVIIFKTKITPSMWIAALIVVVSIIQYSVIQFELNNYKKHHPNNNNNNNNKKLTNGYNISELKHKKHLKTFQLISSDDDDDDKEDVNLSDNRSYSDID